MTERVAIFCPGPSLRERRYGDVDLSPYAVVIGVNEAVEMVPCDWWVFADDHVPSTWRPVQKPAALYCLKSAYDWGENGDLLEDVPLHLWSKMEPQRMPPYSFMAALVLCRSKAWKDIDVFGADFGPDEGGKRNAGRWDRERCWFAKYKARMSVSGTAIKRMKPNGTN